MHVARKSFMTKQEEKALCSLKIKKKAPRSWHSNMLCTESTKIGISCQTRHWYMIYSTCQKMTAFMLQRENIFFNDAVSCESQVIPKRDECQMPLQAIRMIADQLFWI
ncbi:hypothetical protein TNCT_529241 [Trichonephila clavata]|uniref:Uncharacterized protein n=1 Tax=Trichonephila clavata TaxID=2740835 RepID=A0A8X6JW76_TRICU|nr:hypothetical protein TNCT_529241 [Trichonephila clavata]